MTLTASKPRHSAACQTLPEPYWPLIVRATWRLATSDAATSCPKFKAGEELTSSSSTLSALHGLAPPPPRTSGTHHLYVLCTGSACTTMSTPPTSFIISGSAPPPTRTLAPNSSIISSIQHALKQGTPQPLCHTATVAGGWRLPSPGGWGTGVLD